jgi:GTPase SAR1 family protein
VGLDQWLELARQSGARTVLLGNKCDLEGARAVHLEEANARAAAAGAIAYLDVSAKRGDNVDEIASQIAAALEAEEPRAVSEPIPVEETRRDCC